MLHGYVRVSTDKQTVENQKLPIVHFHQNPKIAGADNAGIRDRERNKEQGGARRKCRKFGMRKNSGKHKKTKKMEDRRTVKILMSFRLSQLGLKVLTMKFPADVKPSIGMQISGSDGSEWTIKGVVFDVVRGEDIYDCSVEDKRDILKEGVVLYFD